MDTLTPERVPWVDVAPTDGAEPSAVAAALREGDLPRRLFLRFVAAGAMGVGLAVVGWLPPARPRGAWAHCCLSEWTNGCHGYYSPSTICVPSSAKFSGNCTASNWHRNDGGSGTCYAFRFTHNHTSCDGRNAWRWGTKRCSDGWYHYEDCGGGYVDTWSICRRTV